MSRIEDSKSSNRNETNDDGIRDGDSKESVIRDGDSNENGIRDGDSKQSVIRDGDSIVMPDGGMTNMEDIRRFALEVKFLRSSYAKRMKDLEALLADARSDQARMDTIAEELARAAGLDPETDIPTP